MTGRIARRRTCVAITTILLGVAFVTASPVAAQSAGDFPTFETSAEAIEKSTSETIASASRTLDEIARLKGGGLSFVRVFGALDDAENRTVLSRNRFQFMRVSHPDDAMREAADKAEQRLLAWTLDAYNREDVYDRVSAYVGSGDPRIVAERSALSPVDQRLMKFYDRRFRRNGLLLPKEARQQVVELRKELSELQSRHRANYDAESWVVFTEAELIGVPDAVRSRFRFADGMYHVRATATETLAVYKNSPIEAVRKKALTARYARAFSQNAELSTKIVRIRAKLATLLNNASWAEYQTQPNMLDTPARVLSFLDKADDGLTPQFRKDLAVLDRMKVAESKDSHARAASWDVDRYTTKRLEKEYDVDLDGLREFFEYDHVLRGLFAVAERVFGLTIVPITPPYKWHDDVTAVTVADARSGRVLGIAYLDMFPRPGKRDSFSEWQLVPSKRLANGAYQMPIAALLANFPRKTGAEPVLIDFTDVRTLFHEFGHVLHELLGRGDYALFSGTNVARDFAEAPSVMMESFVIDPGVLKAITYNPANPGKAFPADVIAKLKKSEGLTARMYDKRQIALAKMDLDVHMTNDVESPQFNLTKYTDRIMASVFLASPEATSFANTFRHMISTDYDATYYQYEWAAALSADLASIFEASPQGFMDPEIGGRYRREILEVGGTRDAMQSVEKFLLRPFDESAYLRRLGVQ